MYEHATHSVVVVVVVVVVVSCGERAEREREDKAEKKMWKLIGWKIQDNPYEADCAYWWSGLGGKEGWRTG